MAIWVVVLFVAFSYLSVVSGSPAELHRQPDDGPRCRYSGICDAAPSQTECAKLAESGGVWSAPGIHVDVGDVQRRRDAELACTFDPQARATAVKEAVKWTWTGYEQCAWGEDELLPLSCSGQPWFNLSLTAIDGLDTLYLTGLYDEFQDAVHLINTTFAPETAGSCNLFETTIRILGGLLSAYHLSIGTHPSAAEQILHAAINVGSRLARGLYSKTGIPYSDVELATGSVHQSSTLSTTSEMTTLSLEFTYLARLSGHYEFEKAALRVHDALNETVKLNNGILPQYFFREEGSPSGNYLMLGARSDSYYEYLLKQWIMTERTEIRLLKRYKEAIREVRSKLLRNTGGDIPRGSGDTGDIQEVKDAQTLPPDGLLYVAEIENALVTSKMDHLVCFLPGLLALADYYNVSTSSDQGTENFDTGRSQDTRLKAAFVSESDLSLAEQLADTCYQLYRRTPTGIAPEIVHFTNRPSMTGYPGSHEPDVGGGDFAVYGNDAHNLLRPETVESLFILWKVTGDPMYRERAWLIFRAFEMWTKVGDPRGEDIDMRFHSQTIHPNAAGYTSLESVLSAPPIGRDKMESFWLSETLKYLYLIFVEPPDRCLHDSCHGKSFPDAKLPLNRYVFNTEAHPLPIVGHLEKSLVAPVSGFNESLLHPFGVDHNIEATGSDSTGSQQTSAWFESSNSKEPQQYVLGDNVNFKTAVEMATQHILGSLAVQPPQSQVMTAAGHHEEL